MRKDIGRHPRRRAKGDIAKMREGRLKANAIGRHSGMRNAKFVARRGQVSVTSILPKGL